MAVRWPDNKDNVVGSAPPNRCKEPTSHSGGMLWGSASIGWCRIKVKVYAASHQRALRKASQLTSAHTSQSPTKNEKKENQQRLMRIRRVVSSAMWSGLRLALLKPAALPVTPPLRSPIITVVVKVYFVSCFCNLVQAFYCMAVQLSS
jgi:hypothetical protein